MSNTVEKQRQKKCACFGCREERGVRRDVTQVNASEPREEFRHSFPFKAFAARGKKTGRRTGPALRNRTSLNRPAKAEQIAGRGGRLLSPPASPPRFREEVAEGTARPRYAPEEQRGPRGMLGKFQLRGATATPDPTRGHRVRRRRRRGEGRGGGPFPSGGSEQRGSWVSGVPASSRSSGEGRRLCASERGGDVQGTG